MNRHASITCAMTILAAAIATAIAPAHAGDAGPGSAKSTTSSSTAAGQQASSETTATQTSKKNINAATLPTVVVSPLRESLGSAAEIKRDSLNIVDSIVAEDIGKLPDNSVADALQRIPGVQVAQGFQGETSSVVVRGLPDVVTTLNGRDIFSGVGRHYAFQNLPATAVRTVKVYKTSDASLLDGGIAGLVDMQLYRPFDFKGKEIAGTLTETHSKYAGHTDPTFSFLASNRWKTDYGEFGALANVSMITQHYDYNAVWGDFPKVLTDGTGTPIKTGSGNLIAAPNGFGADYNIGHRRRPEFNYALQWAPNDQTQVYAEGLYDWDHDNYSQPFFFSFPVGAVTPSSYTVSDNCYADQLSGPYQGQTICDAASGTWTGNTYAATSTQAHQQHGQDIQNSIGVKWDGGDLKLSSDLSLTSSKFTDHTFIVDTFLKGPITTVWTGTQGNHQNWYLGGNPQIDPSNFYLNGLFQTWHTEKGHELAWRGDGSYTFASGPIEELQFGVRVADHKARYIGSVQNSIAPPGGAGTGNIVANPNPDNQVIARFPSSYFCSMPTTSAIPVHWLTGCFNYLTGNEDAIRSLYGTNTGLAPENPGRYYNIDEKRYAAYLQAHYQTMVAGMPLEGLIGLRAENVRRGLDAYSFNSATQIYTPISVSTSAPVYLPNFSAILHITDYLQARLSAAKTVTFPGFGQLNPSMSLNPGTINRAGVGSSGNPHLSPIKSKNYDASLEWYFAKGSYVSGDAFYRDINGYIQNYVTNETIGGQQYQISSPQSAGHGHLDGFEVAYQQFFTFLPGIWSGLGAQLNYTYIDGSTVSPQYIGGPSVVSPLQNVSKNNYNAVLFYERNGISARLAYDYRSRFIDFFTQPTVDGVNDEIVPANQVDFSLGYNITKNTTLVLSATNLLGADLHQYWGSGTSRPRDIRYQEQTYSLGVRFKL